MATAIKPSNIDEYILAFPTKTRQVLEEIRSIIKRTAPDASEAISYGMPVFNQNGHYLVYFAGYRKHVSIYPAPRGVDAFRKDLAPYKGGKGTVQFPLDEPLPTALIAKIVKYRMKENKARVEK